jgi:hypothetical protein
MLNLPHLGARYLTYVSMYLRTSVDIAAKPRLSVRIAFQSFGISYNIRFPLRDQVRLGSDPSAFYLPDVSCIIGSSPSTQSSLGVFRHALTGNGKWPHLHTSNRLILKTLLRSPTPPNRLYNT